VTREQVSWHASVLLHLLFCGGFALANFGLADRPRPVVINLSFLAGVQQPSEVEKAPAVVHKPPKKTAVPPPKVVQPRLQAEEELSAPIPVEPESRPEEREDPQPEEERIETADDQPVQAMPAATAEVSGAGVADESEAKTYVREHFSYIRSLIMSRLKYPPLARRMGWSGRVVIVFTVLENGHVDKVEIVQGSGHKLLDTNAVELVAQVSPFPPPPVAAEIVMPITYSLK